MRTPSICINNEVFDYQYEKYSKGMYRFYIGHIHIGRIFKHKNYWSVVSDKPDERKELLNMSGFATRFDASEYLLKIHGYLNDR